MKKIVKTKKKKKKKERNYIQSQNRPTDIGNKLTVSYKREKEGMN